MNKEEKTKLWSERIQQCQTSGKTCNQWCAENGIPLSKRVCRGRTPCRENKETKFVLKVF